MRIAPYAFAIFAGALILAGIWWAVNSEATPVPETVVERDGLRFSAIDPARYGELAACSACHRLKAAEPERSAPALNGIVGAPKARSGWYGYSKALAQSEGDWTVEALDKYLADPVGYLPGTLKAISVRDAEKRQKIIKALQEIEGGG